MVAEFPTPNTVPKPYNEAIYQYNRAIRLDYLFQNTKVSRHQFKLHSEKEWSVVLSQSIISDVHTVSITSSMEGFGNSGSWTRAQTCCGYSHYISAGGPGAAGRDEGCSGGCRGKGCREKEGQALTKFGRRHMNSRHVLMNGSVVAGCQTAYGGSCRSHCGKAKRR